MHPMSPVGGARCYLVVHRRNPLLGKPLCAQVLIYLHAAKTRVKNELDMGASQAHLIGELFKEIYIYAWSLMKGEWIRRGAHRTSIIYSIREAHVDESTDRFGRR